MKYSIDKTIFEKIDCEWKAYFLGWMYSDGNISKDFTRATIALAEKDSYIIQIFSEIIYHCNRPLTYRKPHFLNDKNGKQYQSQAQYSFRISGKKICHDLDKLGCMPNK